MKNVHPLRAARRRAQRLNKLGCEHPLCLFCLCSEPMLLRPVTRRFLEEHHIFGVANDPELTLALCFTCHALITEGLIQAGVTMTRESDPRKFAINIFRALAVHNHALSEALWRCADLLNRNDENSMTVRMYDGTSDIVGFILKRAWPVWKAHRGKVPDAALRKLEKDGDWPRGCARGAMQRISSDEKLRYQLEKWRQHQ